MSQLELDDLGGDLFAQAEALWFVNALAHTLALGVGYLTLMGTPDQKAAYNLEKAAEFLQRGIRRAYPEAEAEEIIRRASVAASRGVQEQRGAAGGGDAR